MASLTRIAYYTKKIIRWGIIGSLGLIILKAGYAVGKNIWEQLHPPPPPPPTVAFDKLPRLQFPEKEPLKDLEFELETPTGELPAFFDQAKVYLSPYQKPSFLAPERAKEQAAKLAFSEKPEIISEEIFRWTKKSPLNSLLEMDIFTGAFTFSYNWQGENIILTPQNPPKKEQAIREAKSFLNKLGTMESDLVEGKSEAVYLKASGTKMIPAPSLSEADFTKVEIFRKDIEEFSVLTADPEKGIVSIIISGAGGAKRIIEVDFNYFPVNYESPSTYPIKSSIKAWEALKNGQAFIANWKGPRKIIIRRVYLAYYDSWEPQEFLQPIFVFQGDDDFFAYVPAITEEWIE